MTYDNVDGQRVERRGGGGLVTALRGLREHHRLVWIASAATPEDRAVAREGGHDVVLVAHDEAAYDRYYNVVANPMLWFVQHSLWDHASQARARSSRFTRRGTTDTSASTGGSRKRSSRRSTTTPARRSSSTTTTSISRRGSCASARPDALLAHFVHIPWPTDWSVLPEQLRRAVHDGLLANDVVGFHTERWARNFVRSCDDITGGTNGTRVTHRPLSVDVAEFERLQQSDAVRAAEATLPRPEKLIVRVDRTDPIEEHRARVSTRSSCCSKSIPSGAGA